MNQLCNTCQFAANKHTYCPASGDPNSELIIVGEAPGRVEAVTHLPFHQGRAGVLLWKTLEELGLKREDFYVTNAIKCLIPKPGLKHIKACNSILRAELEALPNKKLIIAFGNSAMRALGLSTSLRIMAVNGQRFKLPWCNCECLCVIHPASVLRSPRQYKLFQQGLRQIEPPVNIDLPELVHVNNSTELEALADKVKGQLCSADLETTGLNYLQCSILGMGLYHAAEDTCYIISGNLFLNPWAYPALSSLLKETPLIWHNGTYDTKVLRTALGFLPEVAEDTMLLGYCLDTNPAGEGDHRDGGYSLEKMAQLFLPGVERWKYLVDKTKMSSVPIHIMEQYLARDVKYTYLLWQRLHSRVAEAPYRVLLQKYNQKTTLEWTGIKVDLKERERCYVKLNKIIAALEAKITSWLKANYEQELWHYLNIMTAYYDEEIEVKDEAKRAKKVAKFYDNLVSIYSFDNLNLNSTKQKRFLFSLVIGVDVIDTSKAFIEQHVSLPFFRWISQLNKAEKLLTKVLPLMNIDVEGYLHPDLHVHRTKSGRIISKPDFSEMPNFVLKMFDQQSLAKVKELIKTT